MHIGSGADYVGNGVDGCGNVGTQAMTYTTHMVTWGMCVVHCYVLCCVGVNGCDVRGRRLVS